MAKESTPNYESTPSRRQLLNRDARRLLDRQDNIPVVLKGNNGTYSQEGMLKLSLQDKLGLITNEFRYR